VGILDEARKRLAQQQTNDTPLKNPDTKPRTLDHITTIADLKQAGAKLEWLWKGWIQKGVLSCLAAQGGTGKTRFCADLVRRMAHRIEWPDKSPHNLDADDVRTLWVVADNNHAELTEIATSFEIEGNVFVNSWNDSVENLYGGVNLDDAGEIKDLEERIELLKPTIVFIDTVGNSTDKNLSRQEDAKAYYAPLQIVARKYNVPIVCITHLSASGEALGRRVREKVRTLIYLSKPDPHQMDRRKLWVDKSNSVLPPALGVTMGDKGNEYDFNPPVEPDEFGPPAKKTKRSDACLECLTVFLANGPKPLTEIYAFAQENNYGKNTLYKLRDEGHFVEIEKNGKKYWSLPE
jgi:hypothetical protein